MDFGVAAGGFLGVLQVCFRPSVPVLLAVAPEVVMVAGWGFCGVVCIGRTLLPTEPPTVGGFLGRGGSSSGAGRSWISRSHPILAWQIFADLVAGYSGRF